MGDAEALKRRAAERAAEWIREGMTLGLGTGSTVRHLLDVIAERRAGGEWGSVAGVPTSVDTERRARALGIPLATLAERPRIDLTIDGADEVDPELRLIKGLGGALLREKIVAYASARMLVIAEQSKLVNELGAFPLPIEVVGFGLTATALAVERAGIELGLTVAIDVRRQGGGPFLTDSGNRILDASFGRIPDPEALASRLAEIPGIVEHGLFLGFADLALVASADGVAEIAV